LDNATTFETIKKNMRIQIFTILLFLFSILKISAQNSYSLDLNIKTGPTEKITTNETEVGFTVTKKIDSKNTLSNTIRYTKIGVDYELEKYAFQDNSTDFSSIANDLTINHDIDQKMSFTVNVKPTINFEKNIGFSDVQLLGGLKMNYKFNESNSISAGAQRSMLFGKISVLPSFSYMQQINKNTAVAIGFPISQVSYSNNNKNSFSIKNDFQGAISNLDGEALSDNYNNATKMTYSQMATTFEYVRSVDTYWSINFKGGYGFNNKFYLTDNAGNLTYDFNNNNGYIFNIGIKFKH
jgi:hypothetical protein